MWVLSFLVSIYCFLFCNFALDMNFLTLHEAVIIVLTDGRVSVAMPSLLHFLSSGAELCCVCRRVTRFRKGHK